MIIYSKYTGVIIDTSQFVEVFYGYVFGKQTIYLYANGQEIPLVEYVLTTEEANKYLEKIFEAMTTKASTLIFGE